MTSCEAVRLTMMPMRPAPARAPMPCLMAFSTSGCSSRLGTSAAQRRRIGDRHLHRQSIAKPRLLNLDVAIEQRELLLERNAIDQAGVQRLAKQMAQAADHPLGIRRTLMHQFGDRVERVEEKVRLQLHAQHLQSCFREQRLELGGAQLPALDIAIVQPRVRGSDNAPEIRYWAARSVIWKYASPPSEMPRSTRVIVTLTNATGTPMTDNASTRHHRDRDTRNQRDSHAMSGVNAAHTYHSVAAIVSV